MSSEYGYADVITRHGWEPRIQGRLLGIVRAELVWGVVLPDDGGDPTLYKLRGLNVQGGERAIARTSVESLQARIVALEAESARLIEACASWNKASFAAGQRAAYEECATRADRERGRLQAQRTNNRLAEDVCIRLAKEYRKVAERNYDAV